MDNPPISTTLDRDKTRKLLRQDDAKSFVERLQERRQEEYSRLKNASDLVQIGRGQGRVDILEWLLSLKED